MARIIFNSEVFRMADKANKNKTTADLRATLFQTIEALQKGEITAHEAKAVSNLSDQIIKTASLELEYSKTVSHLDKEDQGISPGPLLLTNEVIEDAS